MSQSQIQEVANKFAGECARQEGASQADVDFLIARNMPTSRPQDCTVACVGENIGFVSVQRWPCPIIT